MSRIFDRVVEQQNGYTKAERLESMIHGDLWSNRSYAGQT